MSASARAAFLAPLLACALTGCIGPFTELIEHHYPNTAAAKADHAVGEDMWIPDILPADAVEIREVHNIDTNYTWGCFKTKDMNAFRGILRRMKAQEGRGPVGGRPSELFRDFSWWPDSMSSPKMEFWDTIGSPSPPYLTGVPIRIGIDEKAGLVCFHRKNEVAHGISLMTR